MAKQVTVTRGPNKQSLIIPEAIVVRQTFGSGHLDLGGRKENNETKPNTSPLNKQTAATAAYLAT